MRPKGNRGNLEAVTTVKSQKITEGISGRHSSDGTSLKTSHWVAWLTWLTESLRVVLLRILNIVRRLRPLGGQTTQTINQSKTTTHNIYIPCAAVSLGFGSVPTGPPCWKPPYTLDQQFSICGKSQTSKIRLKARGPLPRKRHNVCVCVCTYAHARVCVYTHIHMHGQVSPLLSMLRQIWHIFAKTDSRKHWHCNNTQTHTTCK